MEVSEETLIGLVREINNEKLPNLFSMITSTKNSTEIINSIESLSNLWNTEGGKESINRAKEEAVGLDTNNLATKLSQLCSERAGYQIVEKRKN